MKKSAIKESRAILEVRAWKSAVATESKKRVKKSLMAYFNQAKSILGQIRAA